jgi:type III restriction enzyme
MQLKFEANQEYQVAAIDAVSDLLEGQPHLPAVVKFQGDSLKLAAVANRIDLGESELLTNLRKVQKRNGITFDNQLECIEDTIHTVEGPVTARFPNFSIEMETGTGKTYVYLRTVLELNKRYGLRKFVVVVPSVAVRQGVLATLRATEKHLRELFDNVVYRFYQYNSENLSQVRQFALSDAVEIMVMTIDSFNKAGNVIRQSTDRLQGETPVHLVQAARPVLILDEPQNMESELRIQALAGLHPLMALRYSATHRKPYNIVYRLTPFEAYRQGLVKRIEVAGVEERNSDNNVFIRVDEITSERRSLQAKLTVHKLRAKGQVTEASVTVKPGDSLATKANRDEYAGWGVEEINKGAGFVRFTNSIEMKLGEVRGADKEAIFDAQIRYTVREHLEKQERMRSHGIKVLSLFFIDRVSNYVPDDGLIRRLFNKAFDDLKAHYPKWAKLTAKEVQAGYFAEKRRRGGAVEVLDSKEGGQNKEDEAAFDLIMNRKEQLLSFDEKVSFIFSHSALREGWDNPNIFQICTLNQTASDVKKRQEIGRGVRLAVNQGGDRVRDEQVNVLTVVANESYQRYTENLQGEIAADYRQEIESRYGKSLEDLTKAERAKIVAEFGDGILPPKPANARRRATAKLRKAYTLKPEFKELWERIKHRTRYSVHIDTDKLIGEVVTELNGAEIRPPRVIVQKAELRARDSMFEAVMMSGAKTMADLAGKYPLPNLVDVMSHLLEHTTPPVRLTKRTLLEIFKRTRQQKAAMDNPHEFATVAVQIIKAKLPDHLVNGIQYEKDGHWYEMTQLEDVIDSWKEYLVPAGESGMYDHVAFQSQTERDFVEGLDKRDDVKLYLKLPNWFLVRTPVGDYNPDWAIVMEARDEHGKSAGEKLYMVRETKGEGWNTAGIGGGLRNDAARKVECGKRHFKDALGVDYRVVTKASELP